MTNISALQRIKHKKDHQPETAGGLAYLCCIAGSCLILFPTFLRSSENTISGVRSKNPISRRQLVPHLQWNSPVNCCFILRPQFGQICLLAPHIALLELCKDFFSRHTAGKQLLQHI
ncbi:hypothetical protein, partial [Faecalibacterium longum]|uniref:hypothetical protein n=1 Tax=Faecalibacterium longum TaxID=1851428 RepID=UPI0032C08839